MCSAHQPVKQRSSHARNVLLLLFWLTLDLFEIFTDLLLVAVLTRNVELPVCQSVRQILLLHIMIRIIMSVLIICAMTEFFAPL